MDKILMLRPTKLYPAIILIAPLVLFFFVGWFVHGTIFPFKEEWRDAINGRTNIYIAFLGLVAGIAWYIREMPRCFSALFFSKPLVCLFKDKITINDSFIIPIESIRHSELTVCHPYTIIDYLIIEGVDQSFKIDCTFLKFGSLKLKEIIEETYGSTHDK